MIMNDDYIYQRKTLQERIEDNEAKMLYHIKKYIEENNQAPTMRELRHLLELGSTSTAHAYLNRLRKKGLISYKDKTPRSIEVI